MALALQPAFAQVFLAKQISTVSAAAASNVAQKTPYQLAKMPNPPSDVDAKAVDGELEPSSTGITRPPHHAAFVRDSAKAALCSAMDGDFESSKLSSSRRLCLRITKAAVRANRKILAAAAALICLYWACFGAPTISVAAGDPASAMGRNPFADFDRSCAVEMAGICRSSLWPASFRPGTARSRTENYVRTRSDDRKVPPYCAPRHWTPATRCALQPAFMCPESATAFASQASLPLVDSASVANAPRFFPRPRHFIKRHTVHCGTSLAPLLYVSVRGAARFPRVVQPRPQFAPLHPDVVRRVSALSSVPVQPVLHTSALSPLAFFLSATHATIFVLVAAALHRLASVLRQRASAKLRTTAFPTDRVRFARRNRSVAASLFGALFCCAACLHTVAAADIAVAVDPSSGRDSPDCNVTLPCRTVEYALHQRQATSVLLLRGTFTETSIRVDGSARFLSIGSRDGSAFDCGGGGPVFVAANVSVAFSGITFRNCVNFNALSGTGGAISAVHSAVSVTNCSFTNNKAQTGGAIGAISSALTIMSSWFENNTATCPNTTTACSSWGGAVAAVEAPAVNLVGNDFSRNAVDLERIGGKDSASRAAGGGGCVSVMYNADVSGSRVFIEGNAFRSCSVRMAGSNPRRGASGMQYGNTYGGAVSLYYGFRAAPSLQVRDVTSSFTNNLCDSAVISARVGTGGNAYGGCLSVYAGAWSVQVTGGFSFGSVLADGMRVNISGNTLTNCSASVTMNGLANGTNAHGGGISVAVGFYFYGINDRLDINGDTTVGNSSYTVSNNTFYNCTASSSTSTPGLTLFDSASSSSYGSNAYGGGISVAVGAYAYNANRGLVFTGDTTVSNSSYTVSNNTLTNCMASSSTSNSWSSVLGDLCYSYGLNTYGGGISVSVGAYVYSADGLLRFTGDTTVSISSYTVSNNTLTNCTASSSTSCSSSSFSHGSNAYGGGISVAVGANSYIALFLLIRNRFTVKTTVSNSSYTVSNNMLTICTASSFTSSLLTSADSGRSESYGSNAYGGGISVTSGAYTYSLYGDWFLSIVQTTVSNSSYTVSKNTLTHCTASSSTSSPFATSSSYGSNAYGGGISVAVGANSYTLNVFDIKGDTSLSNSTYTVSINELTNCTASSSTSCSSSSSDFFSSSRGSNAFGGGISVAMGPYTYSTKSLRISNKNSVSNSVYTVSNNTLTNCTASSSTSSSDSSSSSHGSNAYGGGISVAVGAHSFSYRFLQANDVSTTRVSSLFIELGYVTCVYCSCSSSSSGFAHEALSLGGAVSISLEPYAYPKLASVQVIETAQLSRMTISHCNFSQSLVSSSSLYCSPGASNAAGGALFASVFGADVSISSSDVSHSSARTGCAASSETYSVGGGVAVVRARDVAITATNVAHCFAHGVSQAANVFVSGGGVFVQSESLSLESSSIHSSGVADAFSVRVVPSGGGALGTKNVTAVRISNSRFYDNSDSSSTGVVLLQQMNSEFGMVVNITGSVLSTDPSIGTALPALNISCGWNCSAAQQKRVRLYIENSTLLAQAPFGQSLRSAAVMSLPSGSLVTAANSFLRCDFTSIDSTAALANIGAQRISISCAPCDKPFFVAMTSRTMNLSTFSSFAAQAAPPDSCRPLISKSSGLTSGQVQNCPFGISSCSTIAYVTVGFWTNFTADGNISDATRCPTNYCGCRNTPGYSQTLCQLFPPFAAEYLPEDALCSGNRTGVLCGGCKQNFTQSLNGYSCISNEVCQRNVGWLWLVSVVGYTLYSLYIVITSLQTNSDGLVMCVLFYGQISAFASIPPIREAQSHSSSESSWFSKIFQFESVVSLYENSCYGTSMGAYEATLAQLSGPAIVVVVSLLLMFVAGRLQLRFTNFFRKRGLTFRESFGVSLINLLLLLFSSVTNVVFRLVTCVDLRNFVENEPKRVFIDGTRKCSGDQHNLLVATAALLSLVLVSFFVGLKLDKISGETRAVLCSAYTDTRYYWIAVQLVFRFGVTVISATAVENPNFAAMAMCSCTMFMLVMLVAYRPYVDKRTHCMDIFCHAFLIVQFLLQSVSRVSEAIGVSVPEGSSFYNSLKTASEASFVMRYVPFAVCGLLLLLDIILPRLEKIAEKTGRFQLCWQLSRHMKNFRRRSDAEPELNDTTNDLL